MYFGLSDEQKLLQATLREFAAKELPPARLRRAFDEGSGLDAALWRAAAEVGLQGLALPQRFGGAGQELLDLALAFEVLGETAMPGPFWATRWPRSRSHSADPTRSASAGSRPSPRASSWAASPSASPATPGPPRAGA